MEATMLNHHVSIVAQNRQNKIFHIFVTFTDPVVSRCLEGESETSSVQLVASNLTNWSFKHINKTGRVLELCLYYTFSLDCFVTVEICQGIWRCRCLLNLKIKNMPAWLDTNKGNVFRVNLLRWPGGANQHYKLWNTFTKLETNLLKLPENNMFVCSVQ